MLVKQLVKQDVICKGHSQFWKTLVDFFFLWTYLCQNQTQGVKQI